MNKTDKGFMVMLPSVKELLEEEADVYHYNYLSEVNVSVKNKINRIRLTQYLTESKFITVSPPA